MPGGLLSGSPKECSGEVPQGQVLDLETFEQEDLEEPCIICWWGWDEIGSSRNVGKSQQSAVSTGRGWEGESFIKKKIVFI